MLTDKEKQDLDSQDTLITIIEGSYARSTRVIWYYMEDFIPDSAHQKEAFLYVLEKLLRHGVVKMGRGCKFLTLSIDEIIQSFRDNWPSAEEFDDVMFSIVETEDKKGARYWTPGDLVWMDQKGEIWSTDAEYGKGFY